MAKLSYKEGDFFALPLEGGGFGIGLVARSPKRGRVLFGYFFGHFFAEPPNATTTAALSAADALYLTRFGDLGLHDGTWRVIGQLGPFDRTQWPMPQFFRKEILSGTIAWLVTYRDDNPVETVNIVQCDPSTTGYPEDGLAGSGYVEAVLSRLIKVKRGESKDVLAHLTD